VTDFDFIDEDHVKYLDKGYVKFLASAGGDKSIYRFARGSFTAEDSNPSDDRVQGLINYLIEHYHTSPLEAGEMYFCFKVPIFVAEHIIRHRSASLNRLSLRYTSHNGDYYLPPVERFQKKSKWNKQGSSGQLPEHVAQIQRDFVKEVSDLAYKRYRNMLGDEDTPEHLRLAEETARMVLGTNFYTVMFWKMDTKNILHFLMLRDDSHAQLETQKMAKIVAYYVQREFPLLYNAYEEYRKYAVQFSRSEMDIIRQSSQHILDLIEEQEITQINGSKRRLRDFKKKLAGES